MVFFSVSLITFGRWDQMHFHGYFQTSNYIFILDLTPGFNGLVLDNCKTRNINFLGFGAAYIRGITVIDLVLAFARLAVIHT